MISIPAFRSCPLRAYARSRVRAACLAQEKVLQNKTVFAARERCAADSATHLLVDGLRSRFGFDQLVERSAIRARERTERRRPAASHGTPPNTQFFIIDSVHLRTPCPQTSSNRQVLQSQCRGSGVVPSRLNLPFSVISPLVSHAPGALMTPRAWGLRQLRPHWPRPAGPRRV